MGARPRVPGVLSFGLQFVKGTPGIPFMDICFRHLEPFFGRHSAHEIWHSDAETRTGLEAAYLRAESLNDMVIERAMEKAFEVPAKLRSAGAPS